MIYSSVVTLTLVTNPFTTNLNGAYYGLFTNSPAQFESSGLLTLNLTSLGKFSARILNAGGSYSFSGALSGVGWSSNVVSRGAGKASVDGGAELKRDQRHGPNPRHGFRRDQLERAHWRRTAQHLQRSHPFPKQRQIHPDFCRHQYWRAQPGGDGYGTVNVSETGMVSLSGVLSDNTSVAPAAVSVSQYGRWPLYIPLYGKFGSLAGWIDFTNQGASLVDLATNSVGSFADSNVAWFRTNTDVKMYPGGFTNLLTVIGSAFSSENYAALLDLPNLEAILSGGDLAGVLSNSVTPSANGKFTATGPGISGLTLSLSPSTGVIKGSFDDPAATKPAQIKGVVLQDQTNAGGFFLGSTNSGSFLLTPP